MSLFQDDFYTVKVRRLNKQGRPGRGWSGGSRVRNRHYLIGSLSALGGILLTLLILGLTGHLGGASASSPVSALAGSRGDYNDLVVQAGEKVRPAVVSIVSTLGSSNNDANPAGPQGMGIGSGVIFQKTGGKVRIVTNNHVVEGGSGFEAILSTGERKKAELVGRDIYTDLAVLEMDASGVKIVADFGNSDELKSGETAIAIGNPLGLSFSQSTTVGVISSPSRSIPIMLDHDSSEWEMDVIQTDAAINQGNSGGALVNLDGKVIGINSMKIADTGVEGLGFAIPINDAKPILDALIKDHKVKRAYMGISTQDLQSFKSGVDVLKLPENVKAGVIVLDASGPAKEAGLKTRDVIVELDGKPVFSTMTLRKHLFNQKKIGDKLEVTFYRNGKKSTAALTLAEFNDK